MTSVSISKEDFVKLSISTRDEIIKLLSNNSTIYLSEDAEGDGELTKKQVNEIIKGLSEKSRGVLKAAASFDNHIIKFDDLLEKLDTDADAIKGVWSGITTRCRNVSNDPSFMLIEWVSEEDEDETVFANMRFHPTTYAHIVSYFK